MVDDMRDFDDLEFEGLFRAFDGVTASDALKSRTLAAIAAENATPAIERTQVRPVVSLPQTEDLRAEHMRRPVKRTFRPLHIAVGSAMALLIVAIVGATCWFYPAATVRVEQDDMVVDLGVNVFGACISASAEGEQGEAVLMAEDIRNLSREEAESRLMRRFERMRKDGDFNGAYESTSETTDTTSYTGGKNYGESDRGVAASEQETTQTVSNVEVSQQQPNNLQQQEKPPVNNGQQRQQGGTPPAGNQGQQQQQGQPQPQPNGEQRPQPNDQQQQQQQGQQRDQQQQGQQQRDQQQGSQGQDPERDQGQNQGQRQPQPNGDRQGQSQTGQPADDRGMGGDTSQGQEPAQQQTESQPTGTDWGQQTPPDSGQQPGQGSEGSAPGGSPGQQRMEGGSGVEPTQDMSGGGLQAAPSGVDAPSGVEPMAEG